MGQVSSLLSPKIANVRGFTPTSKCGFFWYDVSHLCPGCGTSHGDDYIPQPMTPAPIFRISPSETDKVRESVMVGSVVLALEKGLFTRKSLLKWLDRQPCTPLTMIAYRTVCMRISQNQHYFEDGVHFLARNPEYGIAVMNGTNVDLPCNRMDNTCGSLRERINSFNLMDREDLKAAAVLLLKCEASVEYITKNLGLYYLARFSPHPEGVSADKMNSALASADWTTEFNYNEELAEIILRRIDHLRANAPAYYAGVAHAEYRAVAVKLHRNNMLGKLTREQLVTFNTLFPNIIDTRILAYSDLSRQIALMGNDMAGYILGFPIHSMVPTDNQIVAALNTLDKDGTEKYMERIKRFNEQSHVSTNPFPLEMPSYANDQDLTLEDIDNYLPFDIVSYQSGSQLYRFTRVEFDQLISSKKNHWTNELLPPIILSTIAARNEKAESLALPGAAPMAEMFDKIHNGTLLNRGDKFSAKRVGYASLGSSLEVKTGESLCL